ncbi:type II secretion system minor pseudopilin GspJ [Solemya velum gill symbiont]|uniref:Type II secretion system protein J n=2 Tax=Solemya velum gill symbiont TaxID=2340 RepID=A0A0B0H9F0_SOVGS|nr:type II secretion system minor pseudopilin GspJ [Solemya velum gill symbiont]KHF25720.1 type II protein secretion system GspDSCFGHIJKLMEO, subunit J [Solemya velum gill symbiont]OOY38310.1 type II secretion system protein GspJ [Solemya velum gill symbiont]OOY40773.1 type II secretion system protein GspJ [Solemya velum gill symbiont]OOY43733.1 type II secretion system protein GspJ [Solemya velum gill symbiont]OOY48460.1 type II secretion system protein GspJ [Solemya velum gill symbiont]
MNRRVGGFTLIELLVSIFILSIISVITYQALQQVLTVDRVSSKRADEIAELQHLIGVMERDFIQIAPRPIIDELNRERAAVSIETNPWSRIEFTRGGVANPLDKAKSSLMRVAWELNNGELSRTTWSVLDRSAQTQPYSQEILMSGVTGMKIRAMFEERWQTSWPRTPVGSASVNWIEELVMTPRGVEVIISRKDKPDVKRLFLGVGG